MARKFLYLRSMRKKEIIGLLLLAVGAGGIYLSAQRSTPRYIYLTARHDIQQGDLVSDSDFVGTSLYLSDKGKYYITGDSRFTSRRSLRKIQLGEIVPRDAITAETEIEDRKLITFTVNETQTPAGIESGDLIDIHFMTTQDSAALERKIEPVKVFEKLRIKTISKSSTQLDGKFIVGVLIDGDLASEMVTLISKCSVVLVQRFDEGI